METAAVRNRAVANRANKRPASGWQAQKSAATQKQVLEAAIQCFVDLGYSGTTTTKIAERAGLSRGAMLHHFPSKRAVVAATIDYLHAKRLKAFRKAIENIPLSKDRLRAGLIAYWKHVTHPMFVAFHELKVTARTDPELSEILEPAQDAFKQEWYRTGRDVFPEWGDDPRLLDVAMDVTQCFLDGMAINQFDQASPERISVMLACLEELLRGVGPTGDLTEYSESAISAN